MSTDTEAILEGVRTWAEANDVPVDSVEDAEIVVTLPGEKKLKTNVAISVFARTAHLQAFVIRHPDENPAAFNRWLLQKNLRPGPVAFAIDSLGDVYLRASVPRDHLLDELDTLLAAMLSTADSSFNELLLIGFITGMKKEWAWRVSRGESTRISPRSRRCSAERTMNSSAPSTILRRSCPRRRRSPAARGPRAKTARMSRARSRAGNPIGRRTSTDADGESGQARSEPQLTQSRESLRPSWLAT